MRNVKNHTSAIRGASARLPGEAELGRAAELLNSGKRIVMLVGQGALHATNELEVVAEKLGAPIVKALLGKAAVPDDSPYTTGGVGLLGTKASQEALENCDRLLLVGTSFPYLEFYPDPQEVRCVQIELNPAMIGLRFPVEVGLIGDSRVSLRALLPLLERNRHRRFLERAQRETAKWWKLMEERGTREDKPMKPQVVAWQLGKRLSDNAIVSCDSGAVATWFARHIPVKRGQKYSLSGTWPAWPRACPTPSPRRSLFRAPVRRLCRRRRPFHAHGRVRHRREVPAAH